MPSTSEIFLYSFLGYFLLSNVYFLSFCYPYYLDVPWIVLEWPPSFLTQSVAYMFYFVADFLDFNTPKSFAFLNKQTNFSIGSFNFLEFLLLILTAFCFSFMGSISYVFGFINYSCVWFFFLSVLCFQHCFCSFWVPYVLFVYWFLPFMLETFLKSFEILSYLFILKNCFYSQCECQSVTTGRIHYKIIR